MIDETLSNQLTRSLETAGDIIIVLDRNASFDQAASAIALSQSLEQAGKKTRLVAPELLPGLDQLSETSRIGTELGHQSLTISFDYSEEKVDNISYHIGEETGKFYLTVKPQAGIEPLDPESVEYSYTGATTDLLILMGVNSLNDLGQLYFGYEDLFRNTTSIVINIFETDFGTIKIDVSANPTTSEFVYTLLTSQNLPISADAATNLLAGIEHATNRLQSRATTADTFETVSKLMKLGARRILPMANVSVPEVGLKAGVGIESKPGSGKEVGLKFSPKVVAKSKQIAAKKVGNAKKVEATAGVKNTKRTTSNQKPKRRKRASLRK